MKNTDVSSCYGLDGSIHITCKDADKAYLCTYVTGKDWKPIAQTAVKDGQAVFNHIGKGVVYLPVVKKNWDLPTIILANLT